MIIDGHAHLFHPKVISNVKKRKELVERIKLQTDRVENRVGIAPLESDVQKNGIAACLILPTALSHEVSQINDTFYETVKTSDCLYTAGTLHPDYAGNEEELAKLKKRKINGIKLCSFSQRFALDATKTYEMFELIQEFNINQNSGFFVELDTLYRADKFFGSHPEHNTTPELLAQLVKHFPKVNFIGAHMGGLSAPFKEISTWLTPYDNLFLDTSNAAYVLAETEFISLLKTHGPEHIVFGTDWPWFTHDREIAMQQKLYKKAGFSQEELDLVFSKNVAGLMEIESKLENV